jgi:hypothetical protein
MIIPKPKKQLTLPKLLKKAQDTFNKYIRERDKDECCISCNSGKVEQASHFYSAGQHSALRFNENNVNGSCVKCNYFLSGNLNEYRIRLIQKIGEQKVLLLDVSAKTNRIKKWSRFELEAINAEYKNKIKSI